MTERSKFWDGTSTGDATEAPYDAATEFSAVMRSLGGGGGITTHQGGVFRGELNELLVSGVATPITVSTGRALVYGTWYEADANVTVAISTPTAGNSRLDRIVLRKDWSDQTVRVTRIGGTQAVSPVAPVLVQAAGNAWDLPLALVLTLDTGQILVFDERRFLPMVEHIMIAKAADEIVNNSNVLQDDDDFLFNIGANEVWIVDQTLDTANLTFNTDFQIAWVLPAGASMLCIAIAHLSGTDPLTAVGTTPGAAIVLASANSPRIIMIKTTIRNGATAGVAQFQWAQNTAVATDSTVKQDSMFIAHRLS